MTSTQIGLRYVPVMYSENNLNTIDTQFLRITWTPLMHNLCTTSSYIPRSTAHKTLPQNFTVRTTITRARSLHAARRWTAAAVAKSRQALAGFSGRSGARKFETGQSGAGISANALDAHNHAVCLCASTGYKSYTRNGTNQSIVCITIG